jgi:hypothetical protein
VTPPTRPPKQRSLFGRLFPQGWKSTASDVHGAYHKPVGQRIGNRLPLYRLAVLPPLFDQHNGAVAVADATGLEFGFARKTDRLSNTCRDARCHANRIEHKNAALSPAKLTHDHNTRTPVASQWRSSPPTRASDAFSWIRNSIHE